MSNKSDAGYQTWSGMEIPFPAEECTVLDFIRIQVKTNPDKVAIQDGQRLMSYRELDVCSNRVANELLRQGLKPEDVVALFQSPSCEFLSAILGVLKAGGTYFPVATDIPAYRLHYLLDDSGSKLVLIDHANRGHFDDWSGTVLETEKTIVPADVGMDSDPGVPADTKRRAYITYTSGSTGQPKGVEIEHRALVNFVCCCHRRFEISAQDRAAMLSYISFDASVCDIWPTLCAGGTLVIPPNGILLNPDRLVEWLAAERITLTFIATGLVEIMLLRPWPVGMSLRFLLTGGDRLRVRPPADLPFVLINGYGPTENTVFSTWSEVLPENGSQQAPPIGVPLANTTAYVLDDQLQPVPAGVEGELYVGGAQVARGYLGRPDLTSEKFLPDPFSERDGARMYRTGDWVRWLPDGELDFVGRKDGQIQIRGRRVELGEVEATLSAHDAVRHVCCVPWMDHDMPAAVVAHIVPVDPSPSLPDEWRAYLEPLLPTYMIPSKFVLHEELPLTAQGKRDRKALIAMQASHDSTPADIPTGGENLESRIVRLWNELLPNAAGSPPDASFASLGGDSLLAIQLMLGVQEITGKPMESSTFLLEPTLTGLMRIVRDRLEGETPNYVVFRQEGSRPPIFFVYGINGDVNELFEIAKTLGEDQPVYGLLAPALHDPSAIPESIEAAATELLPWLRKLQPQGPICLAGYSWGGALAFELARQVMASEGHPPQFIALLDSLAPPRTVGLWLRIRHCLRWLPVAGWYALRERNKRNGRLSHLARLALRLIGIAQEQESTIPKLADWIKSPLSVGLFHLLEVYRPKGSPGVSVDLFGASDIRPPCAHPFCPEDTRFEADLGWSHWSGLPSCVHYLPGNHVSMIRPPEVSKLAKSLRDAMDARLR